MVYILSFISRMFLSLLFVNSLFNLSYLFYLFQFYYYYYSSSIIIHSLLILYLFLFALNHSYCINSLFLFISLVTFYSLGCSVYLLSFYFYLHSCLYCLVSSFYIYIVLSRSLFVRFGSFSHSRVIE